MIVTILLVLLVVGVALVALLGILAWVEMRRLQIVESECTGDCNQGRNCRCGQ